MWDGEQRWWRWGQCCSSTIAAPPFASAGVRIAADRASVSVPGAGATVHFDPLRIGFADRDGTTVLRQLSGHAGASRVVPPVPRSQFGARGITAPDAVRAADASSSARSRSPSSRASSGTATSRPSPRRDRVRGGRGRGRAAAQGRPAPDRHDQRSERPHADRRRPPRTGPGNDRGLGTSRRSGRRRRDGRLVHGARRSGVPRLRRPSRLARSGRIRVLQLDPAGEPERARASAGRRRPGSIPTRTCSRTASTPPTTCSPRSSRPDRYGFLLDRDELSDWRLASDRPDAWQVQAASSRLDYVVAPGSSRSAIRRLTAITGRHRVPPRWALGPALDRLVQFPDAAGRRLRRRGPRATCATCGPTTWRSPPTGSRAGSSCRARSCAT